MIQHTIAAVLICANLAAPMAADKFDNAPKVESLGTFEITAYAEDEITKTGTVPRPMKTVAVDPDVIPLGSELYIADLDLYVIAEDIGGAVQGKVIDLFVGGTEPETASFGRQEHEVFIKRK